MNKSQEKRTNLCTCSFSYLLYFKHFFNLLFTLLYLLFFGVFCLCYEKCFNSFKNSFGSAENDVSDVRTASNSQSDECLAKKQSWQLSLFNSLPLTFTFSLTIHMSWKVSRYLHKSRCTCLSDKVGFVCTSLGCAPAAVKPVAIADSL